MSSRSDRLKSYIPLVQAFGARVVLLHDSVARRLGLNATDLKTLRLIGDGALTPGELAHETGLTAAAVTTLVDRLEAAGFVVRKRDEEDRRKIAVCLMKSKMKEVDVLYEELSVDMDRFLSAFSQAEFEALTKYLRGATEIMARQTGRIREHGTRKES